MTSRLVELEPERLAGWVERFTASHGTPVIEVSGERLVLTAPDGAVADVEVPWSTLDAVDPVGPPDPLDPLDPSGGGALARVAERAGRPRTALLVLVRRGGWAVGTARAGEVLDSSGGTRYVQSRTAAGGWSQQRYARRRSNQADGLVVAASSALSALVARTARAHDVVVPGGDRQLVEEVLAAAPAAVRALPRGPLLDVADPRRRVLDDVARRARCIRVRVDQADRGGQR